MTDSFLVWVDSRTLRCHSQMFPVSDTQSAIRTSSIPGCVSLSASTYRTYRQSRQRDCSERQVARTHGNVVKEQSVSVSVRGSRLRDHMLHRRCRETNRRKIGIVINHQLWNTLIVFEKWVFFIRALTRKIKKERKQSKSETARAKNNITSLTSPHTNTHWCFIAHSREQQDFGRSVCWEICTVPQNDF